MNEPAAVGTQTADPGAQGAQGAGDAFVPRTNEQMLADAQGRLPKPPEVAADADPLVAELAQKIYQQDFERDIEKADRIIERELPDSTGDQRMQLVDAIYSVNIADVVKVVKDIVQQSEEKESKEDAGEALKVEGNSTGASSESTTAKGLWESATETLGGLLKSA